MPQYEASLIEENKDRKPFSCNDRVCGCGTVGQLLEQVFKNVQTIHETHGCAEWATMSVAVQMQVMVNVGMFAAISKLPTGISPEVRDIAVTYAQQRALQMHIDDMSKAANIVADMESDISLWVNNLINGPTEEKVN